MRVKSMEWYYNLDMVYTHDAIALPAIMAVNSQQPLAVNGAMNLFDAGLSVDNQNIEISTNLNTAGSSALLGSNLFVREDMNILNGNLKLAITGRVVVTNNLNQNGIISTSPADLQKQQLYPLDISVGQKFSANAAIDAAGAGYPAGYGLGFRQGYCLGAHSAALTPDCSYGNFRAPSSFGSGSVDYAGGGVVNIQANVASPRPDVWIDISGQLPDREWESSAYPTRVGVHRC